MLKPAHLCCLAAALVALPVLAQTTEAPPAGGRAYRVAAMGDSLTDPRSNGGKFLGHLRGRCPSSTFDSYGKGGQMVNQMRKRFARDILGEPPDPSKPKPTYTHVIVFGGVNDLYSDETASRTVPKIEKDLLAMYGMAQRRGMKVVALTVAPWGGFRKYFTERRAGTTRELNAWMKAQREAGTVDHVIDAHSLLACDDPDSLCPDLVPPFNDGLHFNAKGHERLGEALFKSVFSDCK